jgi:hypothetical protein
MKKDLRFSGCDWQDIEDYFAVERQAKVLAETDTSQQQSDQKTFRENIIKQAKEKTTEARAGNSKASRVEGMRAMRKQENNAERTANAWTPASSVPIPSHSPSQDDRHKQEEYEWLERMHNEEG